MDAIDIMINEHENIKRFLKVIRVMSINVLKNDCIDYKDFYDVIGFVRNYADKLHHAKEESILFIKMGEELGERIAKGPVAGMLIEHDLGRLYMTNLEAALKNFEDGDDDARVDIIANAIGYTDLLKRHIDKENTAIYTFARRALSKETLGKIEAECMDAEKTAEKKGIQEMYLDILKKLEDKYVHK